LTCWKVKSVLSARIVCQTKSNKKDKICSTIRRHVFILNVDRQLSREGENLNLQDICLKQTCNKNVKTLSVI